MLSVLYLESPDCLKHLVEFYSPRATRCLDVTAGTRRLTSRLSIPVVSCDIEYQAKPDITCDARELPFRDNSFDLAIFDPPYLYGQSGLADLDRSEFNVARFKLKAKRWAGQQTTQMKPIDFEMLCVAVSKELARVLVAGGITIVKIADSRLSGKLISNHMILTNQFASFHQLHDCVVYVRTSVNVFSNTRSATNAHGYYLIFRT